MHAATLLSLANRVIVNFHRINKYLTIRHSLSLFKQFTLYSYIGQVKTLQYRIITQQVSLTNMSTARLSGKTLDDVLYSDIEPYKTGMLPVRKP